MNKVILHDSNFQIKEGRIIKIKEMTGSEKLLEINFDNNDDLNHEPGQFIQVSLLGIGESPISVCSSPTNKNSFEICVRAVGKVTKAIHKLNIGDLIGIRGPFGSGFPICDLEGADLIFIAGGLGIAPLRSLINYVIDNRRDFGKVRIMLGCKSPTEMLFKDDMDLWENRIDVDFACTVDKADPDWKGNIGLITSLIPEINIFPNHTYAVVVGPPVMYKFVISELLKKDIPENRILVSLERHMKCGLGKCGHCQIGNIYCCQDGPVFYYDKINKIRGAI